eukprot:TRINITY_DN67813_c1_g1_i1.p1 TRINITY_DN67813_c1_g1~~TRINITY_DN67813_c1_g1_i1.p1  ORF type:complete len:127 (+),score=11.03 TRINITY_DN67813_c1_g1_i1:32-382(+)
MPAFPNAGLVADDMGDGGMAGLDPFGEYKASDYVDPCDYGSFGPSVKVGYEGSRNVYPDGAGTRTDEVANNFDDLGYGSWFPSQLKWPSCCPGAKWGNTTKDAVNPCTGAVNPDPG